MCVSCVSVQDLGQKHFGPVTCKCGMVYNTFDEQDVDDHRKFHNMAVSTMTFTVRVD